MHRTPPRQALWLDISGISSPSYSPIPSSPLPSQSRSVSICSDPTPLPTILPFQASTFHNSRHCIFASTNYVKCLGNMIWWSVRCLCRNNNSSQNNATKNAPTHHSQSRIWGSVNLADRVVPLFLVFMAKHLQENVENVKINKSYI